jgi:TonB family protein
LASAGNTENVDSRGATPPAGPRQALIGSPVAHEARVIATGARPGENSGKRELFTEDTTTALVFPNGGVIRLAAAVEPGQLLFLTNQQTKREVVTQVTRKRNNPATGFYVEVEFTEPAPGFWAVEFPESSVAAVPSQQQPAAAELLKPAEPGSEDLGPEAPPPSSHEVEALMEEVEALRAQLRSMQTQSAAANPPTPAAATPVPAPIGAPALADLLSSVLDPAPSVASPAAHAPEPVHSSAADADAPQAHAAEAAPALAPANEEETFSEEDLLPKPALDFQNAKLPKAPKPPKEMAAAPPPEAASSGRLGLLRLALLAVVSLFAVMVAAWNMHWLPWASGTVNSADHVSSPARSVAKPPAQARPATAQKASAASDSGASAQGSNALAAQPAASDPQTANSAAQASASNSADAPAAPADADPKPAQKENSAPVVAVSKRTPVHAPADAASPPADGGGAIVPPRLVSSVKAVASPDALRDFVTGDVLVDAVVDETGHIKSMNVLSGPPALQKAAMEAVKQYRYEPAKQNGKRVSAHVTVTVPFLFEP